MYDQGQYTNNLYHQLDDLQRPIIVRNQPPLTYRINREVAFNPATLLQVCHSDYTLEPQDPVYQIENQSLQLEPERVVYPSFMVERPFYIEPVLQRNAYMNMNGANAGLQGGLSLYSKDLGATAAIRAPGAMPGHPLCAGVMVPDASGLRIQDLAYALNTCHDYNPAVFLKVYDQFRGGGLNDKSFAVIRPLLSIGGPLGELLDKVYGALFNNFNYNQSSRTTQFKNLGGGLWDTPTLTMLQNSSRQSLFYFWLFMPHASATHPNEADANYDRVMAMISQFVLTGRWIAPGSIPEGTGYRQTYVGGTNPAIGAGVDVAVNLASLFGGNPTLMRGLGDGLENVLEKGPKAAAGDLTAKLENAKASVAALFDQIASMNTKPA